MEIIVNRTFTLTEHDDFVRNVQNKLGEYDEATPIFKNQRLIGWLINSRYE